MNHQREKMETFSIPILFLAREYHDPSDVALTSNRLAVQIVKDPTATSIKVLTSTPREHDITRLRILVLSKVFFAISTRLDREIKLELEVIRNIPDPIQLITKETIAVETEDDALRIAASDV